MRHLTTRTERLNARRHLAVITFALIFGVLAPPLSLAEPFALDSYSFPDVAGNQHALSEWEGRVVALNFWATWCSPCLQEMPELVSLQSTFGDKGLQFLGIAVEADPAGVVSVMERLGVNYPVLIDEDLALKLAARLGNAEAAMPFTVILNREGEVVFTRKGTVSFEEVEGIVRPLL